MATLVEQARTLPRNRNSKAEEITDEHVDLLVAFARDEISFSNFVRVLGFLPSGPQGYRLALTIVVHAIRSGRLVDSRAK